MADKSPDTNPADRAERTSVPVRADCGHAFPVPLAYLRDGRPFTCPVCGQTDHIDEAAIVAAKDQLEALGRSDDTGLSAVIGEILARVADKPEGSVEP